MAGFVYQATRGRSTQTGAWCRLGRGERTGLQIDRDGNALGIDSGTPSMSTSSLLPSSDRRGEARRPRSGSPSNLGSTRPIFKDGLHVGRISEGGHSGSEIAAGQREITIRGGPRSDVRNLNSGDRADRAGTVPPSVALIRPRRVTRA